MHRAAVLGILGFKRAFVRVQTRVLWQKRWMNVQHPTFPWVDEIGRQNPHETCQTDDVGRMGFKRRVCLLYTSPSPRDLSTSRMPSSA